MVKPNTVDVNEVCTTIERITARIMDMLPDKMFYVNYDVTRDQSAEMDLLAILLRDVVDENCCIYIRTRRSASGNSNSTAFWY